MGKMSKLVLLTTLTFRIISSVHAKTNESFWYDFSWRNVAMQHSKGGGICLTESCVRAAAKLFENMNLEADPCEDFNEFACGRFIKEAEIPDDQGSISAAWEKPREDVYKRGKILLEEPESEEDFESEKMARRLYKSCMDEEKLEELGIEPLQDAMDVIMGGWPTKSNGCTKRRSNWADLIINFERAGFQPDALMSVNIWRDSLNSSKYSLYVGEPSLGLAREYLEQGIDSKEVKAYFKFIVDAAVLLGSDERDAKRAMRQVLLFERSLADIMTPKEEKRNESALYNPIKIGDMEILLDIPWLDLINGIFPNINATEEDVVILDNPEYFRDLSRVLDETDEDVISNYIGWRVVKDWMQYLNDEASSISDEFDTALTGVEGETPTWKWCTSVVGFNEYFGGTLPLPVASMYARRYFSHDAKSEVEEMISRVKSAFGTTLKNLDWMDPMTKFETSRKLNKMTSMVGFPDEILDKQKVDGLYDGLDISEDTFFQNLLNMAKMKRNITASRLRTTVNETDDWIDQTSVAEVNAFYDPGMNTMIFPAGVLQGELYHVGRPMYLNYGGIGSVVGHELTHGFDDTGSQRDLNGNLRDWWSPASKQNFRSKAKCIIDLYGGIKDNATNLYLNGINTQGENIADNAAGKLAFKAYESWVSENGEEDVLPGLNFTTRQLFWIALAQIDCGKATEETAKLRILTDTHSPSKYRINIPLSNSEEFAKTFNCAVGSKMNPIEKCTVW